MREYASVVGGRTLKEAGKIAVHNPYTGALVGSVSAVDAATAIKAVDSFRSHRGELSRHDRYTILDRMSRQLEERAVEVGRLITDESGLSLQDTLYEVKRACDVLRFSAISCLQDDSQG